MQKNNRLYILIGGCLAALILTCCTLTLSGLTIGKLRGWTPTPTRLPHPTQPPTATPQPTYTSTPPNTPTPSPSPTPPPPTATPTTLASPTPAPPSTGCPPGTYAASRISDKYHYPTCSHALKILPENLICFETVEAARAAGYQPCGTCQPP